MKYVYNITFVIEPSLEEKLIRFLKDRLIPKLFGEGSSATNPTLRKVMEVGGEKPGPDHGLSMALSADFNSEKEAHQWHDNILAQTLGEFTKEFANEGVFFVTLLEEISL